MKYLLLFPCTPTKTKNSMPHFFSESPSLKSLFTEKLISEKFYNSIIDPKKCTHTTKKPLHIMGGWWAVHKNGPSDKYRHYHCDRKAKLHTNSGVINRHFNMKVCVYKSVKRVKDER